MPGIHTDYPFIVRLLLLLLLTIAAPQIALAQESSADARALKTEQQMTDDERFSMITSVIGAIEMVGVPRHPSIPEGTPMSAGYVPGVPRLGIPAMLQSDASMGVTNPGYRPDDEGATAFPSSILVGSTFNPSLARKGGEAIAREARTRGFNVMLAGGANLTSEVRNGRNYEYYSEDPWLTGLMAAGAVNGIQSGGVISTLKHTRPTMLKPTGTGKTPSSWHCAKPNCSASRSRSSALSRAQSCAATTR